jgi:dTMP kinase
MARAGVRGVDRTWIRNLYGFAIAPHLVFYLKIDDKTLIRRVLQSRGMDYWESGMDLKLGDDIYDNFRHYQRQLIKAYAAMADEFGFRIIEGRKSVSAIQQELRRQIGEFLEESNSPRRMGEEAGAE